MTTRETLSRLAGVGLTEEEDEEEEPASTALMSRVRDFQSGPKSPTRRRAPKRRASETDIGAFYGAADSGYALISNSITMLKRTVTEPIEKLVADLHPRSRTLSTSWATKLASYARSSATSHFESIEMVKVDRKL